MLHQLRKDAAFVPELDFVMEMGEQIIGQNMFMKAEIQADDGRKIPIMNRFLRKKRLQERLDITIE